MIAVRMAQRLAAQEVVAWTPSLRFLPEGIEYRPTGFLGRKEPVVIPYPDIANWTVDQGAFCLWVKDRKKPVVREDTSRPNFFPGFYLLLSLGQAASGAGGAVAEPGA
jgi:hypothetical protein